MFGLEALLASSAIFLAIFAVPVLLVGVGVSYAALRSRDAKSEHPDPELGLKVAYHFFITLGILIALGGLNYIAYDLIKEPDAANQQAGPMFGPGMVMQQPAPRRPSDEPRLWTGPMRSAWGVVAAGTLVALVFYLTVKLGTNDRHWPAPWRLFVGWRLIVAGCHVILAATGLTVILFQKELPKGGVYEFMLATLAVWAPALVVHVFLMKWVGKLAYHIPPPPRPDTLPRARAIATNRPDDPEDG